MSLRTSISKNSEFREKRLNHIIEIGYVLLQVKFYSYWKCENVNKLNQTPPVSLLHFAPNKNFHGIGPCTFRFVKGK